jgi:hypothetical protein
MKLMTAALATTLLAGTTLAQPLHRVLYTTQESNAPTNAMPGGGIFESFQKLDVSPNGQHAALIARRAVAVNRDYALIRNPGSGASIVIRSGSALAAPYATLNTRVGTTSADEGLKLTELSVNDSGQIAFVARSTGTGGPTQPRHMLLRHDPVAGFSYIKVGGQPLPGLFSGLQPGAFPAVGLVNDSNFAAAFSGVNMLADGTVAYQSNDIIDDGSGGINPSGGVSNHFAAFTSDGDSPTDVLNQQGSTPITGGFGYLFAHTGGTLHVTPDGTQWIMRGNQFWNTAGNAVLIRNNVLLYQVGDEIPGLPGEFISNASTAIGSTITQDPLGNWYAPVVGTSGTRALLRNGVIIAKSGDPITPTSAVTYQAPGGGGFLAIPASDGQYAIIGTTASTPNFERVCVLNGTNVLASFGDKVDVNNDGIDNDDRVIRNFDSSTSAFVGTSKLLLGVTLGTAVNDSVVGSAILEITLPPAGVAPRCNAADIANDGGQPIHNFTTAPDPLVPNNGTGEADYNVFFANYFDAITVCDIADDQGIPLPPFGNGGVFPNVNNGVTEGDYNYFFSVFFDGCAF